MADAPGTIKLPTPTGGITWTKPDGSTGIVTIQDGGLWVFVAIAPTA